MTADLTAARDAADSAAESLVAARVRLARSLVAHVADGLDVRDAEALAGMSVEGAERILAHAAERDAAERAAEVAS